MSSGSFKNVINKMETKPNQTKPNQSTGLQILYTYIYINRIWR